MKYINITSWPSQQKSASEHVASPLEWFSINNPRTSADWTWESVKLSAPNLVSSHTLTLKVVGPALIGYIFFPILGEIRRTCPKALKPACWGRFKSVVIRIVFCLTYCYRYRYALRRAPPLPMPQPMMDFCSCVGLYLLLLSLRGQLKYYWSCIVIFLYHQFTISSERTGRTLLPSWRYKECGTSARERTD